MANASLKSRLGRAGVTRRRWLALLTLSAVMAIAIPWWILAAGAAVSNPGPTTISLHDGVFHTALADLAPLTGTMNGNVDASGNISVPQGSISFDPINLTVPVPITVTPSASSNWSGTIDPATGHVTLSGQLTTSLAIPILNATACVLGPMSINLDSSTVGGTPYNPATGDSTLVDNTFVIPPITTPTAECDATAVATINSVLNLDSTGSKPGDVTLTQGALFSPAPQSPTSTTSSSTSSSTTSSSSSTSSSTSSSSTTSSTTSTTAPTTTTSSTTTTTHPTTTTSTTSSTTTTTHPTTTTSTTVPPTTTTTTPAACKPGWGFGDKNHVHCGPPGQTGQHPQNGTNPHNSISGIRARLISTTRPDGGKGIGLALASSAIAGLAFVVRRRRSVS